MKRIELRRCRDYHGNPVHGWEVYVYGEWLGTAGFIWLARHWVRQWWRDGRPAID